LDRKSERTTKNNNKSKQKQAKASKVSEIKQK